MKQRVVNKVHILIGLPGAGKTTFAKKESVRNGNLCGRHEGIVDFDSIMKKPIKERIAHIGREMSNICFKRNIRNVYLDGLFLTNVEVKWVLKTCLDALASESVVVDAVVLDIWNNDTDSCIWNDRGRREKMATSTILGKKIDSFDETDMSTYLGMKVKIEKHKVVRKPEYMVFSQENNTLYGDYEHLYSRKWGGGGSYEDWSGKIIHVNAETPRNFDEFDELLTRVCPNITFLQYKKLMAEACSIEDCDSDDYYDSTTHLRHVCNIKKLYEALKDMGVYSV